MKHFFLALLLLFFAIQSIAQTRIKAQNSRAIDSQFRDLNNELRSYRLYDLQIESIEALTTTQNDSPELFLELPDQQEVQLILQSSQLKTDDYKVTVYTEQGYVPAPNNPVYNYQGYSRANPNSAVRLTIAQGELSGVIHNYQGDNLHFKTVTRAGKQVIITYKDSDLLQSENHDCGNPEVAKPSDAGNNRSSALAAECVVTEIYLIADAAAVNAFGGTPASTEANMLEVLNLVNTLYEPVGVKFEVAGIFISTNPNGPWQVRNAADDQLDSAIDWFNDQNFPGDVFTFWSSPDWDFSYAYVGAICSSFGGNLCAAWGGLTANTLNSNTQAHELGHNFDAGHDATGIMRSTVSNQPASFSANSLSVMTSYIPTVENVCLDECVDDCSNFSATTGPDQNICQGEAAALQASGGSNFSWSPTTGLDNPNSANPNATPTTTTTYTVTVSNSSGCSATAEVTVTVTDLPTAAAGPPQVLSCNAATVPLDGTGSSSGSEFNYLWTTTDGNIVSGSTTLTPAVDLSGTYTLTVTNSNTNCQAIDNVVVNNDASLPTAAAGNDQALTCAVGSLVLDGSNSSQGANYSYLWSTNDGNITTPTDVDQVTVDAAGIYTITVTETGTGCTSFDQVLVTSNTQLPVADAGTNQVIGCSSGTINVGGNSSSGNEYTYQWTTGDGNIVGGSQNAVAQVNASGTYELVVTNANTGCTQSDQVVVTENTTLPLATAGGNQVLNCQANQMTLDGTGSSTGANIAYLWSTANGNIVSGESSLMLVIDQPGTYSLAVTNESTGCQSVDQAIVTISAAPPVANGGADQVLSCAVTEVSLNGSGSTSGANISYLWTTSNGNIVTGEDTDAPTVDRDGTYVLTVTDGATGCTSDDNVEVTTNATLPRADAGRNVAIGCNSNTVDLRGDNSSAGNNFTYAWTTNNGNMISGQATPILTVDAAGVYTLTVTNSLTGCSTSDNASVTLDNALPAANAGGDRVISCQNTQVTLNGTGSEQGSAIRYRWTTSDGNIVSGASSGQALVDAAGNYLLTVTNTTSGCSQSDQVVVTGDAIAPQANAGSNRILSCDAPTTVLGGTTTQNSGATNLDFQWSTTNGNIVSDGDGPQPTVDQAGTYTLTVTNTVNNCSTQDQVVVSGSAIPPTVDAGEDVIVTLGESVQLNASSNEDVTYQWSPADLMDNPNSANPIATPNQTTVLKVTVTDGNNCVSEDEITLIVPVVEDLKVPNSFSPNGDGVNDTWNVPGIEYLGPYTLEVFNRLGNQVHRGTSNWDGNYKGEILPTGTYFYIFKFSDQGSLAGHINIIK